MPTSAPRLPRNPIRELQAMAEFTLERIPDDRRTNLTCPYHGPVCWDRIPFGQAEQLVRDATAARAERRQLDRPAFISRSEIWLVAALLYYQAPKFELQHPVGPWDLDVYFPDDKVCVEVDGSILHNQARDRRRDQALRDRGILTLRLEARLVTADPLWAARQAAAAIASHRKQDA